MPDLEHDYRAWLRYAEDDFSAAALLQGSHPQHCAFFAQQCAEKYLKAFLRFHQVEFRKIHDLSLLLTECLVVDATLSVLKDDCELLTPFAVAPRYPGFSQPAAEDLNKLIGAASNIRTTLRARMR